MVSQGQFREDLYFRLKVVVLQVPALRERADDIPLLVESFLEELNGHLGKQVSCVSVEAMKVMQSYPWPGNVRELEHAMAYAMVRCEGTCLEPEHLPLDVIEGDRPSGARESGGFASEGEQIKSALAATGGNKAKAARMLGVSRLTFYRKLAKYGLSS